MLGVVALACLTALIPLALAQGAPKKVAGGVFGGTTSQGYPVLVEVSKLGLKVSRALAAIDLPCVQPQVLYTNPDSYTGLPISATGKFAYSYKNVKGDGLPDIGISSFNYSGSVAGQFNKAGTRVTGTWHAHLTAYSAADPTGATVLHECDSGVVKFTARRG
jgi:hypothetical protein